MVSTLTALEYVSSHIQQHVRIHRKARTHKSHSSPSLAMGVPTAATPHAALSRAQATAAAVGGMQKSKSSSSVVQHGSRVAKKLWRRPKSQGRGPPAPACTWTSQGHCTWTNMEGQSVTLGDVPLLSLTELERRVLCKVAMAKLQEINLGVPVRIPAESVSGPAVQKPKKRPYLLKKKAFTTGIFDSARKDADKDKAAEGGAVFGIPLAQCLENERAASVGGGSVGSVGGGVGDGGPAGAALEAAGLRRQTQHGSRASFTSLIDMASARPEESGSCESLAAGAAGAAGAGAGPRAAGSVPGLLDALASSGSASELQLPLPLPLAASDPAVPRVVAACFRHLQRFGLDTLGLFRVSASKKRVRQLREEFDCGKDVTLSEEHCPHDVATLLKEFFRDLPDPLLPRELYHAFVHTQRIRNRRLQFEALQHLVQLLPAANRDTLHALLAFLSTVAAHAPDHRESATGEWVAGNKMDSNNLATVFAPNVLHCVKAGAAAKGLSAERADERIDVINVVRALIDHHRAVFTLPADTLDEVYLHMMDSHPDALGLLLRRRLALHDDLADEAESGSEAQEEAPAPAAAPRRVWSREEFLHESAATGGPDLAMRPNRHRERGRPTRKRWSEDGGGGGGGGGRGAVAEGRRRATDPDSHLCDSPPPPDPGVITASLKIPVPGALALDDASIPFIEDGVGDNTRQQMTFGPGGLVRSGPGSGRRRQRTASGGSDSSPATPPLGGGGPGGGHADSALGSSATFSSPPRNTPSLGGSSSDAGLHSSPPSWASSPPTSPDAPLAPLAGDFDDVASAKLSITTRPSRSAGAAYSAKEVAPIILQKVTFTSTSELKQVQKAGESSVQVAVLGGRERSEQQDVSVHASSSKNVRRVLRADALESPVTASAPSTPFATEDAAERLADRNKLATSISSIGGAVMRSKTADIERMLRIQKAAAPGPTPRVTDTEPTPTPSDNKKYAKRRYTDSRHQTRHIPDADALRDATVATTRSAATAADATNRAGPLWKRRELIASNPKQRET